MSEITDRLLAWYRQNARSLPWRGNPDPYAVWVSEIMLQQTQVATVIPYFERWMRRFPTIEVLADADEQDVLALWEGLGYYSRARNLHHAAKLLVEKHEGRLPAEPPALRALPGIGDYTSAAIASIAFGADLAALDGNIRRVFARLYNIDTPVEDLLTKKSILQAAQDNLPSGQAGDYNQALMDLGATVCMARRPTCQNCPLSSLCRARAQGVQEERPVTRRRQSVPTHIRAAAVVIRNTQVLLLRRPSTGLLGGLWEFPDAKIESDPECELLPALRAIHDLEVKRGPRLGILHHAYTHFKVIEHIFKCTVDHVPEKLVWVPIRELSSYPMGKISRQIARMLEQGPAAVFLGSQ